MEYALITGATSGIGYALAECFAKDGVGLVLVSSSLEHLRQTKEKMEQKYDTLIELYEKDLSLPQAAEEKLLENPWLFRAPIVRNGRQATVGYCPDVWKTWE